MTNHNPLINTYPMEDFIDRVKIAKSSNQKQVTIDIKQAEALAHSMTMTMIRLAGMMDVMLHNAMVGSNTADLDGGGF